MIPEKKTCRACGGSGMLGYAEDAPCQTCHGTGYASEEDYRLAYLIKYGHEEEGLEDEGDWDDENDDDWVDVEDWIDFDEDEDGDSDDAPQIYKGPR